MVYWSVLVCYHVQARQGLQFLSWRYHAAAGAVPDRGDAGVCGMCGVSCVIAMKRVLGAVIDLTDS